MAHVIDPAFDIAGFAGGAPGNLSTNITQRTDSASAVEFLADVMD